MRISCVIIGMIIAVCVAGAGAGDVGEVVYRASFDGPEAMAGWGELPGGIRLETGYAGSQSLRVERGGEKREGHLSVRTALPIEKMRGTRVCVEAMIKAEGVTEPPASWNGVECMLQIVSPAGSDWSQRNSVHGTFDWKRVSFIADVPADAAEAYLILGLEHSTGRVWFDDVKITIAQRHRSRPAQPASGPVYKGHDLPRLRGAMISPRVTEADLRVLGGEWKANHIRWQLNWGGFPHGPADTASVEEYNAWLSASLDHLDSLLPVCRELGIRVVVDLHTPPGGRDERKDCRLFQEKRFQDAFIAAWEHMAARYRGNETIWGYDLVNEPVEGDVAAGLMTWRELALVTARKVRAIDPDHAIIIEPGPWGSPQGLDWFEPLDVPGVVYSVHMYQPGQFTHQGVHNQPVGVDYPGEIGGVYWDKSRLRQALEPAVRYQRDYGVHIYIGEFSAIRWAPGDSAERYLRDCIEIFEENGWDWAYHAFREWDGWSLEHGGDPKNRKPTPEPTKRLKLMRSWFEKNER